MNTLSSYLKSNLDKFIYLLFMQRAKLHRLTKAALATALLLMLPAHSTLAEIFKYRDAAGKLHFTDKPMGAGYSLLWRSNKQTSRGSAIARLKRNRSRYTPMINKIAKETALRPALLHAVIRAESAYNSKAISSAGAVGLMQLMPATAAQYGVKDSTNPFENIRAGSLYLKRQLENFQDLSLALAAYNAGENAVRRYGNTIPPFPETQRYVRKVLTFYRQNSRL